MNLDLGPLNKLLVPFAHLIVCWVQVLLGTIKNVGDEVKILEFAINMCFQKSMTEFTEQEKKSKT